MINNVIAYILNDNPGAEADGNRIPEKSNKDIGQRRR